MIKFFSDLFTIVMKNFRLLIRSRSSALVVIFGPLIVVLLLGMAFNTSGVYDINLGVYSASYSGLTNNLVDQLRDERYGVVKYESEELCMNSIKTGDSHVCLVFPGDMAISNDRANNIIFYVDYSRVNLVYAVMDSVNKKLSNQSEQLSLEMTQVLVDKLNEAKTELSENGPVLDTLVSDNEKMSGKVGAGYDTLMNLQLSGNLSDLNISEIDEEVNKIEADYNTSFSDLTTLLDEFETRVKSIFAEFDKVRAMRTGLSNDLNDVKNTLNDNKNSIGSVKEGVNKIVSSISSVGVTNAANIVSPFKTEIKPVTTEKTHLGNMFPSMVVLVIVFIAVLLSSTMVIRERKTKAYFRNFITPTSDVVFLIGDFITNFLIVLLQLGVVFGVAAYFFRGEIVNLLLNTVGVLFLVISLFVLLGMVLGYIFNNQETSTLGAMFVSSILLFFSNTILPLESLPSTFKNIAMFNPFVVSESMLREIILFDTGFMSIINYVYILSGFIIVLIGILVSLRLIKKRESR